MKILIITGIFPPDCGGPATYIPILAGELHKRNHDIRVITLSQESTMTTNTFSYQVHRIKRKQMKALRFFKTICSIIKTGNACDLIFANGIFLEPVVGNLILNKPLIHKFVGDYAWEKAQSMKWTEDTFEEFQKKKHSFHIEAMKKIRTFCAKRSQRIIVPSNFLKSVVEQWGISTEKINVVYNAAEEIPESSTDSSLPLATRYKLIYAGRLVKWKNVDKLIELIAEMQDTGLIIAGEGEEKSSLMNLAKKLKVQDKIYFAGYKPKTELYALMKKSDLFILFSNYEGFPHILLEAMSTGVPVISTDAGGTGEIMQDGINYLRVEKNNSVLLREAVGKVLSNKSLYTSLIEGGKKTAAALSVNKMINETEALFVETINQSNT